MPEAWDTMVTAHEVDSLMGKIGFSSSYTILTEVNWKCIRELGFLYIGTQNWNIKCTDECTCTL